MSINPLTELKDLLSSRIRGVKFVTNENGAICVYTTSARAAQSVTIDLLRSRGFSSVKPEQNTSYGPKFVVRAMPKAA